MRSLMRLMFVWGLMLSVVAMAGAADEAKGKGKKKEAAAGGQQVFQLPKEIPLTDDQKTKLETLKKEHSPKLAELAKKLDEGVTDDQKKARREVMAKAKTDGKKGNELQAEVDKALNLTDEQKKKRSEVQPEMAKLQLSIKEQIHAMLTDDQKTYYKLPKAKKAK